LDTFDSILVLLTEGEERIEAIRAHTAEQVRFPFSPASPVFNCK